MTDYQIAGPTRRCAATGRDLAPGDRFFAALVDENGGYARKDFAADAWAGPPPGTVAFWAARVPPADAPRKPAFNDALLADWFHHLGTGAADDPHRANLRYVVALLLMRRKRLKFEDLRRSDGADTLVLRDAKTGARYEVPDPRLSEAEVAAVQDEVFRALGW
jgi:hypothetical protein